MNVRAIRVRNPDDQTYNGLNFLVLSIEDTQKVLAASIKALRENQDARHMAGIKTACEQTEKIATQIAALSHSLAETAGVHINRRGSK